jgi:hypothetical protein
MKTNASIATLVVLIAGCNQDILISGDAGARRDAGDGGDDAGADAGMIDGGSPECAVGTTRCVAEGREVCVFFGSVYGWQPAPCRDGEVCAADGSCASVAGLDLGAVASAPPWLHPDIGLTEGSSTSLGATRFPAGLYIANPFGVEVGVRVDTGSMPAYTVIGPGRGVVETLGWWDVIAQTPAAGEGPRDPISAWEPAIGTGYLEASAAVPFAAWSFSPGTARTPVDPLCGGAAPSPDCFARSFEGTIVTGGAGTRFVIGELPAAAFYDRCAGEVRVDGVPFLGITALGGTNGVRVALRARTRASGPPTVPIVEGEAPSAAEPGEIIETAIYRGGVLELVVQPPRTEAECAPIASGGCLEPCSARALDLSGTIIETDRAASVIAGHTCARRDASDVCAYSIESLPPIDALGTVHHVPGPASFEAAALLVSVVATEDATEIVTPGETRTLAAGEPWTFEATTDVRVEGSRPILVVRRSQRAGGALASAVVLADDARSRRHLAPALDGARAIVVAEVGATITLDGAPVAAPRPFDGASDRVVVELELAAGATPHLIEASAPASVLIAVVPAGARTMAMTRSARW